MIKFNVIPYKGYIRIDIAERYVARFTITEKAALSLAIILQDHPGVDLVIDFGSKEGISYKVNWESVNFVRIGHKRPPKNNSGLVALLGRETAKNLSDEIKAVMQSISTTSIPTVVSSVKPECISNPDKDLMAGAKRRTDKNLDSVFG